MNPRCVRFVGALALAAALAGGGAGCTKATTLPRPLATEAEARRAACAYPAGTRAAASLAVEQPTGRELPIDHIVLLMQENRAFDHYYSELEIPGLDVAARTDGNPHSQGKVVRRFHLATRCAPGPDHGWDTEHRNFNGGRNDGFVIANGDAVHAMGYYDGTDLPYYYALARTFAFSDRHFSSALAPTWPNRMFYFAGTSWGITHNTFPTLDPNTGAPYPTLFSALDDASVDWLVYAQDRPTPI